MNRIVWIAVLTALNWTAVTQGAPIHWGPATDVFSASEVVNSGTLIEAYNAGGTTSASDQTVNGVLFTGTTSLLELNTDVDVFSENTRDAAYNALLNSVDYGDGTDIFSLEVGGEKLTVGIEYTIQVWYAFNRGTSHTAVGDGENVPNQVELKGNPGQFAIGTFVADGSTQTITFESPMFNKCLITAYQIRGRTSAEEMIGQIQWGPATDVFSPTEVINGGTLIEAWNTGHFDGLVARGNFVISAKWKDGKATELSILSRSGGECRIVYPGIGKAIITDSNENEVKVFRDGNDQIHFASAVGETYTFKTIQ